MRITLDNDDWVIANSLAVVNIDRQHRLVISKTVDGFKVFLERNGVPVHIIDQYDGDGNIQIKTYVLGLEDK